MNSWDILFLLVVIGLGLFGYVIAFGAPYLPTLKPQISQALKLIDLKPGQKLYELGSGDGRVVLAAARAGMTVTGYELNPILVLLANYRLRRYPNANVKLSNFWKVNLADADGIFVFLLPKYMTKLDNKIIHDCRKPVKLVSFAFEITTRKPTRTANGLFRYDYS